MPFTHCYTKPNGSDEESRNLAAFMETWPRPVMGLSGDLPDPDSKPIDHPIRL